MMMRGTAAEFFAGIGLVRLALERTGWDVVYANDIDPLKYEIYRSNFGCGEFHLADIRSVRPPTVPTVSLATASFPCIDLSLAGNRSGLNGRHSSVYWEFVRILKGLRDRRPQFVLIENVVGLLTSHGGADLTSILKSLNHLGYACDLVMVDAVYFVPQSRPRLFITARAGRRASDGFLVEDHPARPPKLWEFVLSHPDLDWDFCSLPPMPSRTQHLPDVLEPHDRASELWWDRARQMHMFRQISPRHRRELNRMTSAPGMRYATVYKRVRPAGCRAELRFDGVAGCLRTPRGGSSKQFLIQAGEGTWMVRNLTAREYARLQGVPDSFRIEVRENQALYGFGDAVCVPAVEWVIEHCINATREVQPNREECFASAGA